MEPRKPHRERSEMRPAKVLWIAAAVVLIVVLGLTLFRPAASGVTNVDAAEVERLVGKPRVVIVDVRSQGEFEMGHIEGAINVPYTEISAAAAEWDRTATYVVYCATGQRSVPAVQALVDMGFEDVRHFNAGIQAWNGPLVQGAPTSSGSVTTDGRPVLIEFYTDS